MLKIENSPLNGPRDCYYLLMVMAALGMLLFTGAVCFGLYTNPTMTSDAPRDPAFQDVLRLAAEKWRSASNNILSFLSILTPFALFTQPLLSCAPNRLDRTMWGSTWLRRTAVILLTLGILMQGALIVSLLQFVLDNV